MRCTRCDGLVLPQAVGIDPDGKVIFGWCLQCLADRGCELVEVSPVSHWRFSSPARGSIRGTSRERRVPISEQGQRADRMHWAMAGVSFLLVSWGLILLAAGLWSMPGPWPEPSPPGHGNPAILAVGGSATAFLGLLLLWLTAPQDWQPGRLLLALLSWLSLAVAIGILLRGVIDHRPARNPALVLGAGLALTISFLTSKLQRSRARRLGKGAAPAIWTPSIGTTGNRATDRRPSL